MDKHTHYNNNFIDPKKFSSLGFFSGDESIVLIFKRVEKIVAATYLVSGLIKDSEPMKLDLREKSLTMLSSALSLNSIEQVDKSLLVQTILAVSVEILSLLNVAVSAGIVSTMNHEILSREIELVITLIKERIMEDVTRAGYVLSDAFFKAAGPITPSATTSATVPSLNSSNTPHTLSNTKEPKERPAVGNSLQKGSKTARQEAILTLLRKGLPLTIKDFTTVITDCSEKTIQRELIEMVYKGFIQKEGERRWSKYSIRQ